MGISSSIQLSDYEQQKRVGHVYTQRPAEFNPARYVSVRTFENVVVNRPISEAEFNSRIKRVWLNSLYNTIYPGIMCLLLHFIQLIVKTLMDFFI